MASMNTNNETHKPQHFETGVNFALSHDSCMEDYKSLERGHQHPIT